MFFILWLTNNVLSLQKIKPNNMKETIESLESLRDLLRDKKSKCQKDEPMMALAYGDAILLVGEEIIKVLNNQSKKLA